MSNGTIKKYQEDPYRNYLDKTSKAESGGNPNAKAKTSSALGKYQFTEGTWKAVVDKYNLGYSLEDRKDPKKSEEVMRLFTKDNEAQLKPILGRELTDSERYLGHFLGVGGASNMFKASKKDLNMPVNYYISPKAIEANKTVFYNKDGSIKTIRQLYEWAEKKMGDNITFANSVAPYMNGNINSGISNLDISMDSGSFASVPDVYKEQETKKEETAIKELQQKEAENNFLEEYRQIVQASPQQEAEEQIQYAPPTNVLAIANQVSQFVDTPIFQGGGKKTQSGIKIDPQGYWNPNNEGKPVIIEDQEGQRKYPNKITKIKGNTMSTEGYGDIPLYVIPNVGEPKLIFPNTGTHFFPKATDFIEYPIKIKDGK